MLTSLAIVTLAVACQETSPPPGAPSQPGGTVAPSAATTHARSPFEWRARVADAEGRAVGQPQTASEGTLGLKVPGVSCEYAVEPAELCDDATCQLGKLWCTVGDHAVQTRTLCRATPETTSESGSSNLRVRSGASSEQIDLSCAMRGSDYWSRPRVRMPVSAAASTAPTTSATAVAVAASARPVAATPSGGSSPANTGSSLAFRWKLEMIDADGKSSLVPLNGSSGALAGPADGWRCRYDLLPGRDVAYDELEFGTISCARSDTTFEVSIVCGRPKAAGSNHGLRNVGSLDLARGGRATTTFMLTCDARSGP